MGRATAECGHLGMRSWTIGILSIIALISVAYGARITITPKALSEKKTGDSFSVSCHVDEVGNDAPDDLRAVWAKVVDGKDVPIPSGGGRVYARSGANRTSAVLIIEKAELEDVGEYKCSFGSDSSTIPVTLYRSATFKDTPTEQHPVAGQDAIIKCRADGDPQPVISWTKGAVTISDGDDGEYSLNDDNDLVIKNYDTKRHDGIYKCEAFQQETGGLETLEISVTGYIPPGPVTVALADQERWTKGVYEDTLLVRLSCTASGVPTPELKWTKNDAELIAGERYNAPEPGVLEIKKMTPDDAGSYICTATNAVGKSEAHLNVGIYLKPRIMEFDEVASVVSGENFASPCVYTGAEPLSAIISQNDNPVPEQSTTDGSGGDGIAEASGDAELPNERFVTVSDNTATLNIKAAALGDAGEYKCEVTNDAGTVKKVLMLEVRKSPTIISFTQGAVRAFIGEQHTLFCEAFAVPEPKWTWSKKLGGTATPVANEDGHFDVVSEGKNSTLKVTILADDDFVNYSCEADNRVEPPTSQQIKVVKIELPSEPIVECLEEAAKPTIISVKTETYSASESEGRRPLKVSVVAVSDTSEKQFSFDFAHDGVYRLTKLEPSTEYFLNVTGQNEAGESATKTVACSTRDPTAPSKPVFTVGSPHVCAVAECTLEWFVDDTGGSDITEYVIQYQPVANEGESIAASIEKSTTDSRYVFTDLQSAKTYDVKVKAVNSRGAGEEAEITLVAPDDSRQIGGDSSYQSSTGPSTGAIVGIVVIIILIIVVLVDVACYYVNQCGLLMCICVNLCGKLPPGVKAKETMMEEGGAAKDTRFEERQEKQPLKEEHPTLAMEKTEVDASESTPMIELGMVQEQKIDTTV